MINRRLVLGMIAAATTIDASRVAFAKEKQHLNGRDQASVGIDAVASRLWFRPRFGAQPGIVHLDRAWRDIDGRRRARAFLGAGVLSDPTGRHAVLWQRANHAIRAPTFLRHSSRNRPCPEE